MTFLIVNIRRHHTPKTISKKSFLSSGSFSTIISKTMEINKEVVIAEVEKKKPEVKKETVSKTKGKAAKEKVVSKVDEVPEVIPAIVPVVFETSAPVVPVVLETSAPVDEVNASPVISQSVVPLEEQHTSTISSTLQSSLVDETVSLEKVEQHNVTSNSEDTFAEKIDEYLTVSKPWFLSSAHIYVLVKSAVASIPYSQLIFDKTLIALCTTTSYINKSTNLNVVLECEDCQKLVSQLDETVGALLVRADDGFDLLRAKLSDSLQDLSAAIAAHKTWVEKYTKQSVSDVSVSSTEVLVKMKSSYETTLDLIRVALILAKDTVYGHVVTAAEGVKEYSAGYVADTKIHLQDTYINTINDVKTRINDVHTQVDTSVMTTLTNALKTVQPYVHSAVSTSTPYIVHAVQVSQPYVTLAKPYIDPLVTKATDFNAALIEHQVVGPYVTLAEETAVKALEGAVTYCTVPVPVVEVSTD